MRSLVISVFFMISCLFATQSFADEKVKTYKVVLNIDNTVFFHSHFGWKSVAVAFQHAKELDSRLASKKPIFLVLDTGGGGISAGLELIQNMRSLNRPVHTVTIFAASMGFQTVQGLNKRLILKTGTLMAHKARGGFWGEFPGQLDARYEYWIKRVMAMDKIAVKRTKDVHTLDSYRNLIENEFWCDGVDCISQGFADALVNVRCDDTLAGSHVYTQWRFMWGGHAIEKRVTKSNCPLITGYLDYNYYIDGNPVFGVDSWNALYSLPGDTKELKRLIEEKSAEFGYRKVKKGY